VTKHGEILVVEKGVVANAEEPLAGGPQRVGGEREGAPGVGEARFGADGCVGLDALGVEDRVVELKAAALHHKVGRAAGRALRHAVEERVVVAIGGDVVEEVGHAVGRGGVVETYVDVAQVGFEAHEGAGARGGAAGQSQQGGTRCLGDMRHRRSFSWSVGTMAGNALGLKGDGAWPRGHWFLQTR